MRPVWVTNHSVSRQETGSGTSVYLVRLENTNQMVEVKMSPGRLARLIADLRQALPDELVSSP